VNIPDDNPSQLQRPSGPAGEAVGLLQQQAGDAAADRATADQGDAKGFFHDGGAFAWISRMKLKLFYAPAAILARI
jgi:hypothetical protein